MANADPAGRIDYQSSDGIAVVTIDRPAKRNALSVELCEQLHAAWLRFRDGEDRVAILTAAGQVFTAGADLNHPPERFWEAVPNVGIPLDKPVIAAVGGLVVGAGVTMAAMCDLCVAAENTRFLYPEAKVGIAAGLVTAAAARMPYKMAMELMLLGEPLHAERAREIGFVNRVVPVGEQLAEAKRMAAVLAEAAPLVIGMLKRLVLQTLPQSPIQTMYAMQRELDRVARSDDAIEGIAAFKQKRKPRFEGK